jgi:hypothetical protein
VESRKGRGLLWPWQYNLQLNVSLEGDDFKKNFGHITETNHGDGIDSNILYPPLIAQQNLSRLHSIDEQVVLYYSLEP